MRAVVIREFGGPDVLELSELPDPKPSHGEVLIRVAAAGVNRADLAQREGGYPPPAGAPEWPGMEISGTVIELGSGVEERAQNGQHSGDARVSPRVGDRVCALLSGGGYAELAVVPATHVLPVPDRVDLVDAAGLPEALATVWSNVFMTAGLRAGELLLMHGGSSGIGTTAIQMARAFGCTVAVTAGSQRKLDACERLGADILINYREQNFVDELLSASDGRGADVILDAIGGDYLDRNVRALAVHGRLVLIGNQSGTPGDLSVGRLMSKWGSIHGSTLRARSEHEKAEIIDSLFENVWPLVEAGQIVPVIDERFALADASRAHEKMSSSEHIGKLLLIP